MKERCRDCERREILLRYFANELRVLAINIEDELKQIEGGQKDE